MSSLARDLPNLARSIGDGDLPVGRSTADLLRLHGEMEARRAERQEYVKHLRASVAAMRAEFRRAHAEMARKSLAARRTCSEGRPPEEEAAQLSA